jgi:predicted RNA binding protein YcfA (HicA-like mRNA interferase family)
MTRRLPAVKPRQVIRALEKAGFVVSRSKGSHYRLIHRDDPTRRTTIAVHPSRDVPHGTLRAIIDQAGLTVEEFLELL